MWLYRRGSGGSIHFILALSTNANIYSQCKLFHSIKPLFGGKPTILVINKIDVCRLSDLESSSRALVQEIIDTEDVKLVEVSCYSEEGVMALKNTACDALLAHRVDAKLKGSKVNSIINRIHVAQPKARDDIVRAPYIPEGARSVAKGSKVNSNINGKQNAQPKSMDDVDRAPHVPEGPKSVVFGEDYILKNPEWKMDKMPEIMDGKNVADFIDPDIAEKLEALEREEERLQAEGFYDSEDNMVQVPVYLTLVAMLTLLLVA